MREKIYSLTQLGRAENLVNEHIEKQEIDRQSQEFKNYNRALSRYQNLIGAKTVLKILLYAGVITSAAASIGLQQIQIINQISSYIGVTFLAIAYLTTKHFTNIYREEYQIKREILISK